MNRFSMYIVLIVVFLTQLLLLDNIKLVSAKPDLLVFSVVFFAIFFGPAGGAEAGFVSGILKDVYSLDIFGVNMLLLSLIGLIIGALSPKIFRESKLTQALLVFVSSVFYMTAHYFFSLLISKITYVTLTEYLYGLILPSSLYTAILSLFLFPIFVNRYRLKESAEYL